MALEHWDGTTGGAIPKVISRCFGLLLENTLAVCTLLFVYL
jgi:hypothetical protein